MDIQELINYISFLNKFSSIKRFVKISKDDDFESDSEHSYQLALVGWYVSEKLGLELDIKLILKYALVHDLVEVYAGDTDPHGDDIEFILSKEQREQEAIRIIAKMYPDFHSLQESIARYESLVDNESKYIYLLDKILPIINTYLTKNSYYRERGVSYNCWKNWFAGKQAKACFYDTKFQPLLDKVVVFFKNVDRGFFG